MNALTHAALDISQSDTLVINHFISEFLKWTLPSLNLNMSNDSNRGFSLKSKKKASSVGLDETVPFLMSRLIWIYTVCTDIFGLPDCKG